MAGCLSIKLFAHVSSAFCLFVLLFVYIIVEQ